MGLAWQLAQSSGLGRRKVLGPSPCMVVAQVLELALAWPLVCVSKLGMVHIRA